MFGGTFSEQCAEDMVEGARKNVEPRKGQKRYRKTDLHSICYIRVFVAVKYLTALY